MTEITRTRLTGFLGPEFDDFLFAPIGADRNGSYLSVASALARMDLDPWAEATKLAKLPIEIATQKLSAIIGALQEIPVARQEPGKIAARLIVLLPNRIKTKARSDQTCLDIPFTKNPPLSVTIFLITMVVVLGAQVMMHIGEPSTPNVTTHGLISGHTAQIPSP